MKICFVIDNEKIFHPNFVYRTFSLLNKKYDIEYSIGLVSKIPNKSNISRYFFLNFFRLKIFEFLKLLSKYLKVNFLNLIFNKGLKKKYFSLQAVANDNKIKLFEIKGSINDKKIIKIIKDLDLDLIISSNSLYFGEEILSLPRHGCINRHSSLLPKYAGLLPVFHAISKNEKQIGISVHLMNYKIDDGPNIIQEAILLNDNKSLFKLYELIFEKSSYIVASAVDRVIENKFNSKIRSSNKPEYYSMPSHEDWINFRRNNGIII